MSIDGRARGDALTPALSQRAQRERGQRARLAPWERPADAIASPGEGVPQGAHENLLVAVFEHRDPEELT